MFGIKRKGMRVQNVPLINDSNLRVTVHLIYYANEWRDFFPLFLYSLCYDRGRMAMHCFALSDRTKVTEDAFSADTSSDYQRRPFIHSSCATAIRA